MQLYLNWKLSHTSDIFLSITFVVVCEFKTNIQKGDVTDNVFIVILIFCVIVDKA